MGPDSVKEINVKYFNKNKKRILKKVKQRYNDEIVGPELANKELAKYMDIKQIQRKKGKNVDNIEIKDILGEVPWTPKNAALFLELKNMTMDEWSKKADTSAMHAQDVGSEQLIMAYKSLVNSKKFGKNNQEML